ncbi:hypothetical protein D3C81_393720 [compost metagenome]
MRRVGHRHLVFGAKESGRGKHGRALLAFFALGRVAWAAGGDVVRPARLQVDAAGPGDFLHERKGILQLATGRVDHIEKAIAIGLAAVALAIHVEGNELIGTIEIPGIIRRILIRPLDLARFHVQRHGGRGIQVVAGTQVAVPWRRVARAEIGQLGLRIISAAHPGGSAARFPQVARPGFIRGAGHAVIACLAILVVAVAHVPLDRRARPHQVARHGVARLDPADDAEFAARHARQQQAFGDQRCGRHRVAGRIVVDFFLPDDLARVLVQRHQIRIERAENHQVAIQRGATVDHVAAGHDAVWQAMLVFPQLGARFQVDGENARIRSRDKHLAIVNQRLRFLAPLLFTAKRK